MFHAAFLRSTEGAVDDLQSLSARPTDAVSTAAPSGLHPLTLGNKRDSYLYVPEQYDPARPAPLALMLHGAGGHAHHGLALLKHLADDKGLILVAPASTGQTWDVIIHRSYGTDTVLVDETLQHVFANYAVDEQHVAIGGFSDGASYALSLGLANGELFGHVIAFSPGFIAPVTPRGQPRIFISHGIHDDVLPIGVCSRSIVPRLQQAEYDVRYHEFEGAHAIPPEIAQQVVDWFLQ